MPRPLAILGGTFDPVHNAHLRVAWEAAEFLDADVRLVPTNIPPHRAQPVASAAQRLAILRTALSGQDRLQLDDRELRRKGPSYTIDTLIELRAEIGLQRALVLLVGADAFAALPTWHRWRELFDHAHIGVLTRPGHMADNLSAELDEELAARRCDDVPAMHASATGRVIAIAVTALEISASRIRTLLAHGCEPRYLLPDRVLAQPELLRVYRAAQAFSA
ncbi:MAG: nicotinate-nucleotide adenylyltransferase [Dokdonella sp.]